VTRIAEKRTGFRWEDWPRQLSASTYGAVRDRYVEGVSACPDVVAVFQMGESSVPGISDIDLIVVVKEELSQSRPGTYALPSEETALYCFSHTPYVAPRDVFLNLERFWWTQGLKPLGATGLAPLPLDDQSQKLVGLSLVVDYIPLLLPVVFSALESRVIPVRKMLAVLNSVRYSFSLLEPFEPAHEWTEFGDQVAALRSKFFKRDAGASKKALLGLMEAAARCMSGAMTRLDSLLQSRAFFGPLGSASGLLEISPTTWYRFAPDWMEGGSGVSRGGLPRRLAHRVVSLPPGLLPVYQVYAGGHGPISARIRSGLKLDKPVVRESPAEFENILREKMYLADRQASFLQLHGFSWGQMALFPFYRRKRLFRGTLERAVAGLHWRRLSSDC